MGLNEFARTALTTALAGSLRGITSTVGRQVDFEELMLCHGDEGRLGCLRSQLRGGRGGFGQVASADGEAVAGLVPWSQALRVCRRCLALGSHRWS